MQMSWVINGGEGGGNTSDYPDYSEKKSISNVWIFKLILPVTLNVGKEFPCHHLSLYYNCIFAVFSTASSK